MAENDKNQPAAYDMNYDDILTMLKRGEQLSSAKMHDDTGGVFA